MPADNTHNVANTNRCTNDNDASLRALFPTAFGKQDDEDDGGTSSESDSETTHPAAEDAAADPPAKPTKPTFSTEYEAQLGEAQ